MFLLFLTTRFYLELRNSKKNDYVAHLNWVGGHVASSPTALTPQGRQRSLAMAEKK